jgi:hypothetical protein
MLALTPQMKILVAIEPADFRKGIDGLVRLCKDALQQDPLSGTVFCFRNRRSTAIKVLMYDGQGFWLCQKRLSQDRFGWWPQAKDEALTKRLAAHQLAVLFSRNMPQELKTIIANCLAHARRQFVEVHDRFPEECRTVLEALKVVYHNDAIARDKGMSPAERLAFHQAQSQPAMTDLQAWLKRQFDEKLVEPNSALGTAINYLKKHWSKLTLFLRKAGAPLDNNLCERALKKAILHRKNSLFFKTPNGARVGDLYMSLIHTCELNAVNPFDYLTELMSHPEEVAAHPERFLPWNYCQTLAEIGSAA